MKINLRGHHLLCIQGFQGYGYNKEFIVNMKKIKSLLKKDTTILTISNCSDDICRACPNLKNDICKNSEYNKNIVKMDNIVISKLKIENPMNAKDLLKLVNQRFDSEDKIEDICKNCYWFSKCLFANKF